MRTFAKVSLAILLMAVLAWASDPWKNKPYQDWNQKEVTKVLNDSPWVKTIHVRASWDHSNRLSANSQFGQPTAAGQQNSMGGQPNMSNQSGMPSHPNMGGGGMPGNNGMNQGSSGMRQAVFEARWLSAKTMREALARMEVLHGRMSQPHAAQYVAQTPPTYQIIVFGPDMAPFQKLNESELVKHSYLRLKKSKLDPSGVKFSRGPKGKRVMAVTFLFPKKSNGQPTVPAGEKGVELICKLKSATLKFHFDPRKMKNKNGRDL